MRYCDKEAGHWSPLSVISSYEHTTNILHKQMGKRAHIQAWSGGQLKDGKVKAGTPSLLNSIPATAAFRLRYG